VEEDIVSIEARALLSTGSIRTSSQAFMRNQFLHADEALQEFQEKVNQCKSPKERYELCRDLGAQVMLQKEVLDAQVRMVWETIEGVDGFEQHKAKDKELWDEVERVAKTSEATAK
jgi:hypothetical protein